MLSINLPTRLEKQLWDVVQDSYRGNLQVAMIAFIKLHKKYGWKEQLLEDVQSIRSEVRRKGGINAKSIEAAVKKYRKSIGTSRA